MFTGNPAVINFSNRPSVEAYWEKKTTKILILCILFVSSEV